MVIIETPIFTKVITELMSDDEYKSLQEAFVNRPEVGTMINDAFNELLASVEQANNIIEGKTKASRVTEFAEPEVKAIRAKTGLSQSSFANVMGVSKRTLENWEQGRRHPTGPARALLKIVDADPEYALKALNS